MSKVVHKALLTDLDNTLYNWVDFFAPSFRGMVHVLSRETGFDEDTIYASFKRLYGEHGSIEYSYSIQELDIYRDLSEERLRELVDLLRRVFTRIMISNLEPYPGVKETLSWATRRGIVVIGVTNASLRLAEDRIKRLGLSRFFYGLAARANHEVPEDYSWTREMKRKSLRGTHRSRILKRWEVPRNELKPNPTIFLRIIEHLQTSAESVVVIGDSLSSDVQPALRIGAVGVWAEYGQHFERKNWDTLLKITDWDKRKIAASEDQESVQPTHVVRSFADLREIIVNPPQMSLPGID